MTTDHELQARLAVAEDARRAAEAALRESERLAMIGSWTWLPGPDTVTWSEQMFRIAGRDPQLGAPSFAEQTSMYADPEVLRNAVQHMFRTGETFEVEVAINRPDGTRCWIMARGAGIRDGSGKVVRVYGTARDVTAARAQRDALQAAHDQVERSERRYRDLVENLVDVVFSLDLDGRIEYISSAVERFGYTVAELTGTHFTDTFHPDDRAAGESAFRNTLAGDEDPAEFRILHKNGGICFVQVSARAVYDAGRMTGLTGVAVDVTEQRRAEDQLRVAQRLEAVGRLAGGIAHDFNNLLVVILGFADLALDRLGPNDPGRGDLEQICRAGERAAELIRQLLAFSRRQVLQPEVIDLNDIVRGVEAMLRRVGGETVIFTTALQPNLPSVLADPGQIEQVLMNLVVNARQAMAGGGKLRIETDRQISPEGASIVLLRVRDTGQGMDEATKAQIFEPFFTTKPQGEGTGLGLSTVYGIVQQSGGSINVDTAPGRGTTFTLSFPADVSGAAPAERLAQDAAPTGDAAETVLVVEPEDAVRDLAYRFLSTAGYNVIAVRGVREGERAFEQRGGRVDLLLTEMALPAAGGEALASRLRSARPDLRVLFMADASSLKSHDRRKEQRTAPVVRKPFTRLELSRRVRDVLDRVNG